MNTFIQYLVGLPRASIHAATRVLMLLTNVRMLACVSQSHSCKKCRTRRRLCSGVQASGEPHGLVGPRRVLSDLSPMNMQVSQIHRHWVAA